MALVAIYTDINEINASLTKGFLEEHGIKSIISPSSNSRFGYWVELDPMGANRPYDIEVDEKNAKEALELLQERDGKDYQRRE